MQFILSYRLIQIIVDSNEITNKHKNQRFKIYAIILILKSEYLTIAAYDVPYHTFSTNFGSSSNREIK